MQFFTKAILAAQILAASTTFARSTKAELCSSLLLVAFKKAHPSEEHFRIWITGHMEFIRKRQRSFDPTPVDAKNASTAIRRAIGAEWDVPTKHFEQPHYLDDSSWVSLLRNLEYMRDFFHAHREYESFSHQSFSQKVKPYDDGSGKIHPIYFENVVRYTFSSIAQRLEYAREALKTLKAAHRLDSKLVPQAQIDDGALRIAIAITKLRSVLPKIEAMAFQLYRLDQAHHETFALPEVEAVDHGKLANYVTRNSSFLLMAHDFFRMENAMLWFNTNTEARRAFELIQQKPDLLENY